MPRIEPLSPPFTAPVADDLTKLMPPGVPPLALFRMVAHNPRVLRRMRRGGLLDPPRGRCVQRVGSDGRGQRPAVLPDDDRPAAGRADVDADVDLW